MMSIIQDRNAGVPERSNGCASGAYSLVLSRVRILSPAYFYKNEKMVKIIETKNFIVEAVEKPHIDRDDGGHIKITPKSKVVDRQHLSAPLSIELMRLIAITGEAMTAVMNRRGVDIGRINYQDMGNWSVFKPEGPFFHYHIYGRAKSARYQKYGECVYLPLREQNPEYYDRFKPLNEGDIKEIKKEIERLFKTEKYSDFAWKL